MARNSHKTFRWPGRQSISLRMLFFILLYSSFFTLLVTAIQLLHDYRQDINIIEKQIDQIQKGYSESVARNVWNFDKDGIRMQLDGLLRIQDIDYVEIFSTDNTSLGSIGKVPTQGSISRRFPLEYQDAYYSTRKVGELYVIAGLKGVYARIWSKAVVILGSQAVKTFMVSGIIILIIQYLISQHLKTMGQYARKLDLNRLEDPLVLPRRPSKTERSDELDLVVSAINQMRITLKKSVQQLEAKARMEGELNAAAAIQRSLLPARSPVIEGFDVASMYFPANEVSGDYYDFIAIDNRHLALVVVDVSGKGVAAAMHANSVRVLMRNSPKLLNSPARLCCSLNRSLQGEMPKKHFLTMNYLLLDYRVAKAIYVSAGHEPIVVCSPKRPKPLFLKPKGYPLGGLSVALFAERIQEGRVAIQCGDMVFLYTDGLTDVFSEAGERFGEKRLYDLVHNLSALDARSFLERIIETVRVFQGHADQPDDITMIALKRFDGDHRKENPDGPPHSTKKKPPTAEIQELSQYLRTEGRTLGIADQVMDEIKIETAEDVRLSFPGITALLELIRRVSKKATARAGSFSDPDLEDISMALDEACANVIIHSYAGQPRGYIQVTFSYDPDKFTITLTDDGILGRFFNPGALPSPGKQHDDQSLNKGGMGVYLIKTIMDEVKYSVSSDMRNCLTMVKYMACNAKR